MRYADNCSPPLGRSGRTILPRLRRQRRGRRAVRPPKERTPQEVTSHPVSRACAYHTAAAGLADQLSPTAGAVVSS